MSTFTYQSLSVAAALRAFDLQSVWGAGGPGSIRERYVQARSAGLAPPLDLLPYIDIPRTDWQRYEGELLTRVREPVARTALGAMFEAARCGKYDPPVTAPTPRDACPPPDPSIVCGAQGYTKVMSHYDRMRGRVDEPAPPGWVSNGDGDYPGGRGDIERERLLNVERIMRSRAERVVVPQQASCEQCDRKAARIDMLSVSSGRRTAIMCPVCRVE